MIGCRLVDEAPRCAVHCHQAGLRAVPDQVGVFDRLPVGLLQNRNRSEERVRRIFPPSLRTGGLPQPKTVPRVTFGCHRPRAGRMRQELLAQLRVAGKPARRQNNAAARADRKVTPFLLHDHARYAPIRHYQAPCGRRDPDGNVAVEHALEELAGERVAEEQTRASGIAQPVGGVAHDELHAVSPGGKRFRDAEQMVNVGHVHHHAAEHHEFLEWVPKQAERSPEGPSVERRRVHRSAAGGGAFHVRIVVGGIGACDQLQLRVPTEIFEHRRTRFQESELHLVASPVADDSVEIELRLLDRVFVPQAAALRVIRDPNSSARNRCRPSNHRSLLDDERLEAFDGRGQGGAHASRSRAHTHHVGFVVPPHCWLVGAQSAAPRRE